MTWAAHTHPKHMYVPEYLLPSPLGHFTISFWQFQSAFENAGYRLLSWLNWVYTSSSESELLEKDYCFSSSSLGGIHRLPTQTHREALRNQSKVHYAEYYAKYFWVFVYKPCEIFCNHHPSLLIKLMFFLIIKKYLARNYPMFSKSFHNFWSYSRDTAQLSGRHSHV